MLTRIRNIEVLSGPPLAPEEDFTDDIRNAGWAFMGECQLGLQVEAMMSLLGCRD